jgi:hypothetical protein
MLVCDWLHSVWTKSLICKDPDLQGILLFRSVSEDYACKSEDFRIPVSCPDDRAIPSERPSVHSSIRLDDVPYRPDARQTKHHPFGRRVILFGSLSSPSGRPSIFDQAFDSFQS